VSVRVGGFVSTRKY